MSYESRPCAREKFAIGDRVILTEQAHAIGVVRKKRTWNSLPFTTTGTVVGFGQKYPHLVTVVRDGHRTRGSYHMDFWERVKP